MTKLTIEQKAQLYQMYSENRLSKRIILRFGYDISDLFEAYKITMRTQRDNNNEHYLCRCSKCNSRNVAIIRACSHANKKKQPVIHHNYYYRVMCRECGTETVSNNYVDAMVLWNKGVCKSTSDKWSLEDTQEEWFMNRK